MTAPAYVAAGQACTREQFYAISVERRLKNPAVVAICEAARHELFAPPPRARARGAGKPRGRAPVRRS